MFPFRLGSGIGSFVKLVMDSNRAHDDDYNGVLFLVVGSPPSSEVTSDTMEDGGTNLNVF